MIAATNVLVIFWNFWCKFIIDVLHFDFP